MPITTIWKYIAIAFIAMSLFLATLLAMHTGYPQQWNDVQAGMTIERVRAICGPATYDGGMHPESWEKPLLFGTWVLSVGHSEETQGSNALVSHVQVYFEVPLLDLFVMHHEINPPLTNYALYYKAFGEEWKPTPSQLKTSDEKAPNSQ